MDEPQSLARLAERRAVTVFLRQVRKAIAEIPTAAPGAASLFRPDCQDARKCANVTQINEISGPLR
jgi:hypothetical protein